MLVIFPAPAINCPLLELITWVELGTAKLARFSRLKASARNSSRVPGEAGIGLALSVPRFDALEVFYQDFHFASDALALYQETSPRKQEELVKAGACHPGYLLQIPPSSLAKSPLFRPSETLLRFSSRTSGEPTGMVFGSISENLCF